MKKPICILIVCEYPYLTAEAFLESEINKLGEVFEKIYIFSLNIKNNEKKTRVLPGNAYTYPLGSVWSFLRYPYYMFKGIFCKEKSLKITLGGVKGKLSSLYARGRSDFSFNKIKSIIERDNINAENVTVYSYWFTDQAVTAWRLKEYLIQKGSNVKAFSRGHGYDVYWDGNMLGVLPFQDVTLGKLDGTYICSRYGRDYLANKYPKLNEKIKISRLGTRDYGIAVANCGVEKVFVTCSRFRPLKRLDLFATAFCEALKFNDNIKWVAIGDGEDFDKIKSIITKNSAEKNVSFVGRMTNEDVLKYYQQNNVSFFCNVSSSEGVPVSIMEAMSFGIPVLATDVGGNSEIVDNQNGFLIDAGQTPESLSKALISASSLDEEAYMAKRALARKTWEEKASSDKNYNEWCRIISNFGE